MFRTIDNVIEELLVAYAKVEEKNDLVDKYCDDLKDYEGSYSLINRHSIYLSNIEFEEGRKALYLPFKEGKFTISLEGLSKADTFIINNTIKLIDYLEKKRK